MSNIINIKYLHRFVSQIFTSRFCYFSDDSWYSENGKKNAIPLISRMGIGLGQKFDFLSINGEDAVISTVKINTYLQFGAPYKCEWHE